MQYKSSSTCRADEEFIVSVCLTACPVPEPAHLQRALLAKVVLAARDDGVLRLGPGPPADEAGKGQLVVLVCGRGPVEGVSRGSGKERGL